MDNVNRKAEADRILHEFGLLDRLKEIGEAHIIGSYRMDMMAWNDLDIDVNNDSMSLDKLHALSRFILDVFKPVWYEAKQEITSDGKTVWFHGFETMVTGELWNVDIWFFDQKTIEESLSFCDTIKNQAAPQQKEIITDIKKELISMGLYSFDQYKSIDVYHAVLQKGAKNTEEFLDLFR